jgi:hypothetical protein
MVRGIQSPVACRRIHRHPRRHLSAPRRDERAGPAQRRPELHRLATPPLTPPATVPRRPHSRPGAPRRRSARLRHQAAQHEHLRMSRLVRGPSGDEPLMVDVRQSGSGPGIGQEGDGRHALDLVHGYGDGWIPPRRHSAVSRAVPASPLGCPGSNTHVLGNGRPGPGALTAGLAGNSRPVPGSSARFARCSWGPRCCAGHAGVSWR